MQDLTARIHSFESFGTVDGPGIRFVIFFQGCRLKCKYCHNRDLWEISTGKEWNIPALFKEVQKYRNYFRSSGGGITASGGDAILQADFLAEFFAKCQKAGIHTALDTAGGIPISPAIEKVLDHTDLVLLDIKHSNPEKHLALTGIDITNPQNFARYLSDREIPMWIRHVVVPGWSDSNENITQLAAFVKTLKAVEKVELLPFHQLGAYKWELMHDQYALEAVFPPTVERMEELKKICRDAGLPVS